MGLDGLESMSSKGMNTIRRHFNPLVPGLRPAIVVDDGEPVLNIAELGLKPLIDCIFHVHPHVDAKISLEKRFRILN